MDNYELRAVLDRAAEVLAESGVPDPVVDAELLLGSVLSRSRGEIQLARVMGEKVSGDDREAFVHLVRRRMKREPLQHITGRAPFRHMELEVGPGVFVPRPETELAAEIGIAALRSSAGAEPLGVDLGTGSGALALSLATEVPHAQVYAVERSEEARTWAARNIARIAPRVRLVAGDFRDALSELDGAVDVIVTNPPYVPLAAVPRDPEVRFFDPAAALYSGEDGLDDIRVLSVTGRRLLRPGGLIVIEHGEEQGASVRRILSDDGWLAAETHRDLTSRDRVTTATASG